MTITATKPSAMTIRSATGKNSIPITLIDMNWYDSIEKYNVIATAHPLEDKTLLMISCGATRRIKKHINVSIFFSLLLFR